MFTARINLKGTLEGDLLLSALVEKANAYKITINDKSESINVKGKAYFSINTNSEKNIMALNISPKMPITNTANTRVDVYRKGDNGEATSIVVTLDEPYVVVADSARKRLVVRKNNSDIKDSVEVPNQKALVETEQ